MNIKQIVQSDVKRVFDILKVANNHNYALIPEVAKELKVSKIDLTYHVLNNPKLFYAENIFSYKEVKVKRRLWLNDPKSTYLTTENVKNRNLGMGLKEVYLHPIENYRTNEWLENKILTSEKYISIHEVDNYGFIEGYTITVDVASNDDKYRFYRWRNTAGKLKWLKENGYTKPGSFAMGGFGDIYTHNSENVITFDKIKELESLGWTHNPIQALSR